MDAPEMTETQVLQEAGDKGFADLEAKEKAAAETLVIEDKQPVPDPAKPDPAPSDKGEDDKFAWMKGLDEKTLADLKDGKLIPKHRLDEVLERSKAYESLGTPEDVSKKLADLSKKIEATPKGEAPELTAEEKETQAVIQRLFPELKTFTEMQKKMEGLQQKVDSYEKAQERIEKGEKDERSKFLKELAVKGRGKIKEYAAAMGWDANDEATLKELEGDILGRLNMDEAKEAKFYKDGDLKILDEVFENYKKKIISGASRETEANILKAKLKQEKLTKPPLKGAPASDKEESTADMDWSSIGDKAVSRI